MSIKRIKTKLLTTIFNSYIELVYKTSKIEVVEKGDKNYKNCVLGFWHGDSCINYLLFRRIKERNICVDAIITADSRGDFISFICEKYNINPLRIPDGLKIREHLKFLKDRVSIEGESLAIALDGPLGPLYNPKKLAFTLSNSGNKNFVKMNVKRKGGIVLKNRWDNYVVPTPFGKYIFELEKCNVIEKEDLKDFENLKERFKPKNL